MSPLTRGVKKFTFTWRIEKYSYCWHETEEQLISPVFVADTLQGTRWTLGLYPRGHAEGCPDYVSFYLNRSEDSDGPDNFAVNFELSFLADDGSVLVSLEESDTELSFKKGKGLGDPTFLERTAVLLVNKDAYLPQDTLTARCIMWKGIGDVSEAGQCFARTRIGIERVSFVHVVERFSSLQPNQKATTNLKSISEELPLASMSVCITRGLHCEEKIMVEISCKQTVFISCVLFLLDAKGNGTKCGQGDACCDASGKNVRTFHLGFSKSMLMSTKNECLPNDSLSLRCECAFTTGLEINKIEQMNCGRPLVLTTEPNANSRRSMMIRPNAGKLYHRPSGLDDFRSLYEDQTLSDVKIKTETETFFAHKSVLCARSPVFKAIFVSDMKEKATDSIRVDDLEDDTVRRLLLFLYSDEVEDLQWETAEKLYYAADKYQVQQLRVMCSSFLMDNLSVSNAIDALVLADRHQDHELKTTVENFIVVRDEEIFRSEAWKTFMKINPLLALETMHFKYEKK